MGNNLENIKIGDTVVFTIGNWHQSTIIDKVDKISAKQFAVGSHHFWKKDGSMVGDRFRICRIATEKDIADFKMEQHRNSLRSTISNFFEFSDKLRSLSIEEMEKIVDIIKDKT